MKKVNKNVYVVIGNGKELECETKEKALQKIEFLNEFFDNEFVFAIEEKVKADYEIEKGDNVHWIKKDNQIDTSRVDKITEIIKDAWGDVRYKTKEINGSRIGIAYKKDISLIL